jgi:hypothetical protein
LSTMESGARAVVKRIMQRRRNLKRWREVEFIGRQAVVTKEKARDWITLYRREGISLQVNPTYMDFRLWFFSRYGDIAVDLDREKVRRIGVALGITRLLISNTLSHGVTWRSPYQFNFKPRLSKGERSYFTRQYNVAFVRPRKRKRINNTPSGASV